MSEDSGDKFLGVLHKIFASRRDARFQNEFQKHLEEIWQILGLGKVDQIGSFEQQAIKKLIPLFPKGFRITDDFTSMYNCFGFVWHYFYPDRYPYLEEERPDGFEKNNYSSMKFIREYEISQLNAFQKDQNYVPGKIIAFASPTVGMFPHENVLHVGIIVNDSGRIGIESKLGTGYSTPRIINYDLGDLVKNYLDISDFTHLQIYKAE